MMEKTDDQGDYIWALKASIVADDETHEWKNRRAIPLQDIRSISHKRRFSDDVCLEDSHTRIMASLVPDEIIYNIGDYSKRAFEGCLLFGDVSGFTDLCEKYNKSGKGGPSKLTQVLNRYIGAMVQEILSHSGDVLKFSGDAFIALWKVTDHLSLKDAVHEAIDCALVIQKSYGAYHTDVDVIVRVKLAVSCGHLLFSLVGDEEISHYLMTGQPIYDIKVAESKSLAGEIVITARVSHHVNANEYLMDLLPDGVHAKVLGVGPNWRNIQRHYENKDTYSILSAHDEEKVSLLHSPQESFHREYSGIDRSDMNIDECEVSARVVTDQYALRPAVNHAARLKLKDELRRFIIAPVVRGIDAEEPLEYLTEIRQVVILFINCKLKSNLTPYQGIDVSNQIYFAVCNTVKGRNGCVNKISNFDKDTMLLVIFGLRGFKHELESQIALKCAKECYAKIQLLENVQEVSAGITTGKTYCGAFGHTLRREYTVLGLAVNKAARIMVAYPNKVTCDRETFLHSKLEARNFILLKYMPLKGIINPGPIYEFKEVEGVKDGILYVNPLPLLGREQEIDLYQTLLNKAIKLSNNKSSGSEILFVNMLVIQGVFRQGKTRLLEEFVFVTDMSIPINSFTLSKVDYEVPYTSIRSLFAQFVGSSKSTIQEREKHLRLRLRNRRVENFLCALNDIFNVKFPESEEYHQMDDANKYRTLKKMFVFLCYETFVDFWVIIIDDAEYIDVYSWKLVDILVDLNLVFLVASMGIQKEVTQMVLNILKNPKIKIIELKGIDKWYHVGLACQMLDLDGIPPELEKIIQLKCNGNPGWIESFLVSVMQSDGLHIFEISRNEAFKRGLVIPPLYMTMRLTEEEKMTWVEIMEERQLSLKENLVSSRWKMFVDSTRESYPDFSFANKYNEKLDEKSLITVCTLNSHFSFEDVEPELHIDVIILKIFDALTSYEQLLLKCSAILGDVFPRDMLLYIMSSTAVRLTAVAVKKLFEIQVLTCARGNFLEGGLNFKDRLLDPNDDLTVKCECKGLIIAESCEDLPKYASCGYLRFRSSEFRETTYNLLTDNQKREFHERAIRYLEKGTRRCRACGNGYFIRQMGQNRLDDDLRGSDNRRNSKKRENLSYSEGSVTTDDFILSSRKNSYISHSSLHSGKFKDTNLLRPRENTNATNITNIFESSSWIQSGTLLTSKNYMLRIRMVNKLKDDFNLTKTFSSSDFSQCTCLLILSTFYAQLIEHCKGAGLAEKLMTATIEYAYICLECRNAPQAIKVLEEALVLLEGPMKDQLELEWMVSLKKAKLLTLLGKARMILDDDEAYLFYMNALKCYGVTFPTTQISKRILIQRHKLQHKIKLYCWGRTKRCLDDDIAEYCNNVAECLFFLCTYFRKNNMWQEAELTALWSLSKAVETETDFEILCNSYGNLIVVASTLRQHSFCVALEVFALRTCHRKKSLVELEELKAISFLYAAISRARLLRAELEKNLHIGYILWRLATSSHCTTLLFATLPLLARPIILKKQITEFGNLLAEILFLAEKDIDNSARSWYYALCVVLHLECGYISAYISKCISYTQTEALDSSIRDPAGITRLVVVIWLWEIRNENWEAAIVWQNSAWKFHLRNMGDTITNLFTALYLLEGLIIYMVGKMDRKNFDASNRADKHIQKLIQQLSDNKTYCKIIIPRLYHLQAYYLLAKDNNNYKQATKLLKRANKLAMKQGNVLESSWIKHNDLAWCHRLSQEDKDLWRDHADDETAIHFHDLELLDKCIHYSLPLPIYM